MRCICAALSFCFRMGQNQSRLRKAGEFLNAGGHASVHEKVVSFPLVKSEKIPICRCWQSARFPLCDNSHERLQRQGVNVGPALLEVKKL